MKSIQRYLLTWVLTGMMLLCLAVGTAVYQVVARGLVSTFDAELNILASEVRFLLPEQFSTGTPSNSDQWEDFFVADSGSYFEVWDEHLLFSDPSPSLQGTGLPLPDDFSTVPTYANTTRSNGEPVRTIARRFDIPGNDVEPGYLLNVVVARNRVELDAQKQQLVFATVGVGLIMLIGSGLIIHLAVRGGLAPLRRLDRELVGVDADRLNARFNNRDTPRELEPVIGRLNELMSRLESGFERERRFGADLAHELRTPVAELKTLAEVALQFPDTSDTVDDFTAARDIADRLQATIETLLLLARASTSQDQGPTAEVKLRPLIERCVSAAAPLAAPREIQFAVHVPDDACWSTHANVLEIVLSNLINNAASYAPTQSTVSIRLDEQLEIANAAPDLTADDVTHLFDRLWRKDAARSSTHNAGLGLTLAQASAELIGLKLHARLDESSQTLRMTVSYLF